MFNTLQNIQIDHWDGLKSEFILAIIFIQKHVKSIVSGLKCCDSFKEL